MAKKLTTTPEPIAVTTICSVCGLGWELHGAHPTTDDCISLLKAELARRPYGGIVINPAPVLPWRPYNPHPWQTPWYYSTSSTNVGANSMPPLNLTMETPEVITSTVTQA